jgi:citrate synthase
MPINTSQKPVRATPKVPPTYKASKESKERLTTAQAAKRLGVKPTTIYAYVSRGVLTSLPAVDRTGSTFAVSDIEMLAQRGRPRQASRSQALDFTIDTAITAITQHSLSYRGLDAVSLSTKVTFEQVTDLLLTGSLPSFSQWPLSALNVPPTATVFDHVALASVLASATDPLCTDLDARAVPHTARTLIASVVDSLPVLGDQRAPRLRLGTESLNDTIAGRLWIRLSPRRPTAGMIQILNAALVLMADHELAVSAVAARVAASTRAHPYAVVLAGVAAMSGPLHGGASRPARRMLERAMDVSAPTAVSEALQINGMYPGFGHKVYKHGDPRAVALIAMMRSINTDHPVLAAVDASAAAIWRRREVRPNIDLALGAFGIVADLDDRAAEAIFCIARIAGWIAHALEEYTEAPLRFRARAVYTGELRHQ